MSHQDQNVIALEIWQTPTHSVTVRLWEQGGSYYFVGRRYGTEPGAPHELFPGGEASPARFRDVPAYIEFLNDLLPDHGCPPFLLAELLERVKSASNAR